MNEIDRSNYDKVDNSLPNAPVSLITGVADKGQDYALTWIDSLDTFKDTYGIPTNEYESYFYNAAYEILNHGGICIAAKLPYDNGMKDKYTCIKYSVGEILDPNSLPYISTLASEVDPSLLSNLYGISCDFENANKYSPITMDDLDSYLTNRKVGSNINKIIIVDITRGQY